jgi:phosphatidylglycerol:prolipoprotein diacylglycerol transferase
MNVQFPGLGWDFTINNWAFQVFGIKIYWYGIIIAAAFLVAVLLATRDSQKYDIKPDDILDLVLFCAPAAIIGARLYYVAFSWNEFKDDLLSIFMTRNGGLAVYGGVIGAFIAVFFVARHKKIPVLRLLDFGVPYLALGQAIGRWGNFVNQEAFGSPTNLPWRMNGDIVNSYLGSLGRTLDLTKYGAHPTFFYESLWDFALFLFLAVFRKRKKVQGEVLFLYLILYGIGRAVIEGLRTDSLMLGSVRVSQLLSVLLVLVFATIFIRGRLKQKKTEEEEPADLGQSRYGSVLMKMKEEENAEHSAASAEADADAKADSEDTAKGSPEKASEELQKEPDMEETAGPESAAEDAAESKE